MDEFICEPNVRNIEDRIKLTRNDNCAVVLNAYLDNGYPKMNYRSEEQIMEDYEADELKKELDKL